MFAEVGGNGFGWVLREGCGGRPGGAVSPRSARRDGALANPGASPTPRRGGLKARPARGHAQKTNLEECQEGGKGAGNGEGLMSWGHNQLGGGGYLGGVWGGAAPNPVKLLLIRLW